MALGAVMNRYRREALVVVLKHIDRHPGEYTVEARQTDMLKMLIKKYDLKLEKRGSNETTELDAKTYRNSLTYLVKHYARPKKGKALTCTQLLMEGSRAITSEGLQRIGYSRQPEVANSEGSGAQEDDVGTTAPDIESNPQSPESNTMSNSEADPDSIMVSSQQEQARTQANPANGSNDPKSSSSALRSVPSSQVEIQAVPAKLKRRSVEADDVRAHKKQMANKHAPHSNSSYAETVPNSETEVDGITISSQQGSDPAQTHVLRTPKDQQAPSFSPITVSSDNTAGEASATSRKRKSVAGLDDRAIKRAKSNSGTEVSKVGVSNDRAPTHPTTVRSRPSARRLKLGTDTISKDMNAIWTTIQSNSSKLINGANANGGRHATWSRDPDEDLGTMYQLLFGSEWKEAAFVLSRTHSIKAVDVVEACMAAAIHKWVFLEKVPWDGPEQIIKKSSDEEIYYDQVLKESGSAVSHSDIVWQAHRMRVVDSNFQETTIRPIAEEHARNFMHAIGPQLSLLKIEKADETSEAWWRRRIQDMAGIFTKAMALKGLMQASPGEFRFDWVKHGGELDAETMEDLYGNEAHREVAWCVAPAVRSRSGAEDEWEVVCRAKVVPKAVKSK
ncbi:hypothetical protein LTR37_002205 [Vermiconidia calcicola]|uniref:Uncharacterized protein n=1 Tax=Vermiconidia calcicola TaxID=1690605 RepID=A0ACC3NUC3_9PEZI|nr:hypothetical protein LTR37_002205 [Vermiconidia calcicola]